MNEKIKITFPDGTTRSADKGTTGQSIAESISKSLAKEAIAIEINSKLCDLSCSIDNDTTNNFTTFTAYPGALLTASITQNGGVITANGFSGTAPYTYLWSGPGFTNTNDTITNLSAGLYNAIIVDGNGCQISGTESIGSTGGATITSTNSTDPTCFGDNNGSIDIAASGGTGALTYSIDGGSNFQWTSNTEERNRLWQARHDAAYACKVLRPGGTIWATDVCVPISRLAECIRETREDIEASNLIAPIAGHVGDGNFHLCMVVNHNDPEEQSRADALHERMIMRALAMDGTCTGEHGIGYGKLDFLIAEHGDAVSVMRSIKKALDPHHIMNPGKIVRH